MCLPILLFSEVRRFLDVSPCSLVRVYRQLEESSPSINLMIETADLSGVVTIYHTKRHHTHKDSNLHSRCRRNFNLARNCVVVCQECAVRYLWLVYVIWRLDMASTGWSEVRILEISDREPQEFITCSSRPWPSDTTFVRHLLCPPALAVWHCDSTKNAEVIRMWKLP